MAKYSELTDEEIRRACELYGVAVSEITHMAGGAANTTFKIDGDNGDFALTVLDNTAHLKFPVEVLPQILENLRSHDVLTNAPRKSTNNRFIEQLGEHTLMMKSFVDGDCYMTLPDAYLPAAGAALARLHSVPLVSGLPQGARRLRNADEFLPRFDDQVFAQWVREKLENTGQSLPPEGSSIIHGDYASDNLVVTSAGDIAIIDWETASIDDPIIDVGWAIVGLCCADGKLNADRLSAFLRGYESKRAFDNDERMALKQAAIYAATVLGFYRYVRQHIRFPNPAKFEIYREMWKAAEDIESRWAACTERAPNV